ncbi:MAG: ABC transporter substrate-binding protein [bacterium]
MAQRQRSYVRLVLGIILMVLATGAVFATGQQQTTEEEQSTLVVGVQGLPQAYIEAMAENSNVAHRVNYSVGEYLIRTDYYDNFKQKPGLAESWELVDERTLVLNLREGVLFHNGEELTADDVAFTFGEERVFGTDAPAWPVVEQFLSNIESVTAIDRYTVEVKAKKPDALLVTRFANYPTQIISRKGYEDAGSFEAFARMPVGTGPYKVVEFTDGERVVLERFEDYWGDRPGAVDRIEFRYVPEVATRIAGLRAGDFDIITEVPPDQAQAVDSMNGVHIVGGPIANIYGMFFDETNDSPMQDPRFREALTVAIDREQLVSMLFGGITTIPRNWQMELFGDMYLTDIEAVPYDPDRARALLDEAGYDGERIEYRSLPDYYTLEQTVAEAVTQMWQDVGINVELRVMENWTQVGEDDNDRHIINGSFSAYYPDPVGQFWRRFGINGGKDGGAFWTNSDEFNQLGARLETETDLATRRDTFREMIEIFNRDPKGLYLYALPMIYGVRDGIDWTPLPVEGMDFSGMSLKSF